MYMIYLIDFIRHFRSEKKCGIYFFTRKGPYYHNALTVYTDNIVST